MSRPANRPPTQPRSAQAAGYSAHVAALKSTKSRKIGLALPGVEEGTAYGSPALKIRGQLLACIAIHKSAEPDTLAVRIDFGRRDEMIAEDPDTYYLTDHYVDHPIVLVRLSRVHIDALRDLLAAAWRFVSAKAPTRKRTPRALKTPMHPSDIVAKPRDAMPQGATTLPAAYYVDPAFFRREMDALFAKMWVCAGRAEQIARPGQFFVRELLGDSIIVTRGASGAVNAFYNVCRHRGTRLCTEGEGVFAGTIQCPYHAWTYDLDGRLVGAPHMDEVPHFRNDDYPLHRVHADVWDGHIFINLAERPAPLLEQLADLPRKFRPWRMEDLKLGKRIVYDVRANWKLVIQNYSECLHCPNLHPALNKLSHYLSGENEPLRSTYMGGRMDLRPGVDTLSMDGSCPRAFLPGLAPADVRRVHYYAIFPNMLLSLHPDYMMVHTLWPMAVDRTINICEWHFHPDEIARDGFTAADAIDFWDMTNRQDWHVCELSQSGISSRAYTPGPYSNREDLLYAFDRMIVGLHEPS